MLADNTIVDCVATNYYDYIIVMYSLLSQGFM